jgi:hypothetical protein
MNVTRTVFLKNTKEAKKASTTLLSDFGKDFLNKHFTRTIGKNLNFLTILGKQVYREKKVGEYMPLPQNVKDKYKSNFESIVMTIMNNRNSSINKTEPVIELELKKQTIEKTKNSSTTSEESSEDYFEKARVFSTNVLNKGQEVNLNFKGDPILLKKNSFLAFGDNFEEIDESDVDDVDAHDSDHKAEVDPVEALEQDKL